MPTEAATDQESIAAVTTPTALTSKESNSSSSRNSSPPPSPSSQPASEFPAQSNDLEEDTVTEEPGKEEDALGSVAEEKATRGRGRTPAKKRGRVGRRR